MASATDGYVVGYVESGSNTTPAMYRYNGSAWVAIAPPAGARIFASVSAGAPGEAWIGGYNNSFTGYIYRYVNGSWASWQSPDYNPPTGFAMVGPTRGWANTGHSVLGWNGA